MKVSIPVVAAIGVLLLGLAAAAPKDDKPRGIFAPLEKGTKVNVKETAQGFEIGLLPGGEGYTVKEVAQDFVVVEDIVKVSEIRIPIYSVKAVKILRRPKNND